MIRKSRLCIFSEKKFFLSLKIFFSFFLNRIKSLSIFLFNRFVCSVVYSLIETTGSKMAKKGGISKNSRAARRGQVDQFTSSEAKELASIPRLEKTDTVTPLIRSSLGKNQQLLNEKLNRVTRKDMKLKPGDHIITNHTNKKKQHMVSKTIRTKQHKFESVDGRLGKKIEEALKRKKRVSNLRKTGWEKINEIAKHSLTDELITQIDSEKKTNADIEDELADEMRDDEVVDEVIPSAKNPFDLLTEE